MALNDNLNTIKEKATEVVQSAARAAKDAAARAKAKVDIMAEEDKIRKAQLELGKLYYRDFAEGADPVAAEYLPWCEKITAAKETIEALKAAIEATKAKAAETAEDVEEEVNGLVDEIVSDVKEAAEDAEEGLKDIKVEVIDEVKEAAEDAAEAVQDAVEDVKDAIDDQVNQ